MAIEQPRRADARRNRDAVLNAAEEVFAEEGLDVQTPAIAQRAGVGVGTVFRHFPTKEALIEAIGERQLQAIVDRIERSLTEPDPPGAFERLMWHFTGQFARYRAVPRLLANPAAPAWAESREALYRALSKLVALAQDAGRMRPDLEMADILLLMNACAHVADSTSRVDPAMRKRFMAVVFDGLRATGGERLPPLGRSAQVDTWLTVYRTQKNLPPS
ncbi:helix-turn-helix domain-containing protein [Actinoplanes sp. NPDC049802]|uniref:TetR/AcrR family transcriptional regulator n=1 Tax=Actinoplanes sp. NPDC049802 TaxID=3154742 RepID=UPI0033CC98C5